MEKCRTSDLNSGHSKFGVDFGSAKTLIDLCFCSSCQQSGAEVNIDISSLADQVKSALDIVFSQGRPNLSWQDYLDKIYLKKVVNTLL